MIHRLIILVSLFCGASAYLSQAKAIFRKGARMTCSLESGQTFKVLALHGKGENGASFKRRLSKLVDAYPNITWEFLTAPHLIGGDDEFAWWTLPPNVRSFEASEYMGIDQTFQACDAHPLGSQNARL
jgi:hypothetical protein